MMFLWGNKFISALASEAKPENKYSLDKALLFDKLKKIPFHIRKTNAYNGAFV